MDNIEIMRGQDLIEQRASMKKSPIDDKKKQKAFVDFVDRLEEFCDNHYIPTPLSHVVEIVTDESFPEYIRQQWEETYLRDNFGFGNVPFGHLIDWRIGIEEAKEERYKKFDHEGETYWVGI